LAFLTPPAALPGGSHFRGLPAPFRPASSQALNYYTKTLLLLSTPFFPFFALCSFQPVFEPYNIRIIGKSVKKLFLEREYLFVL
ncbi:MAG: hypothetical protein IIY71_01405, partial [Oscillospiraceae bacterium]|nr:hypothetical protein [Oscillospiraceae bacterium]